MRCSKHHVEHTGSNCYLLDFYEYLGEREKGKEFVGYLLQRIVKDGGKFIFYPGLLDPMNMSNNVIDCGSAVDALSRYLMRNRSLFTSDEHMHFTEQLRSVVDTYLAEAARDKPLTNQRLWGLTGVASFAKYAGEEGRFHELARASIEQAFADMTADGFFRYYPDARVHGAFEGYDGITAFYQSRCSSFIRYSIKALNMDGSPYEKRLAAADRALLAMYTTDGTKDLRLECKRWYWQSPYEVASAGFDAYALAASAVPEAKSALHNLLYQVRRHFFDGYLHSHIGLPVNFQCPIFWTAHLAWMLRVQHIDETFSAAERLSPFAYALNGKEIFTDTSASRRILVNARWQERNPTVGVFENGLEGRFLWRLSFPRFPPSFFVSVRETGNHVWVALRGLHIKEALLRCARFAKECAVMLLPRYSTRYGKVDSFTVGEHEVTVVVSPASKYGTLLKTHQCVIIPLSRI